MTFDEFLGIPDDGIRRELIRGVVRERGPTIRDRFHGEALASIGTLLSVWLEIRPRPSGEIVAGEVGFRIRGESDTALGIDVAYASAELAAATPGTAIFEGAPVLAVEIVSPTEGPEEVAEKLAIYREIGTVAWVVDTDLQTVTIYRPDSGPSLLRSEDEIRDQPYLPGFRARVSDIFE
jgi:Uma2 family endonuclease